MPALPFLIAALCCLAISYRYYSAFLAAKVLALDPKRKTPAHTHRDGQNYYPMNRWVLFGHHFAAISGAGPLIGPVLAAQFGFLPGYLWLVIGVCVGGAVQDFVILAASIRHDGKSLAEIARQQISPLAGVLTSMIVLFVVIVALSGLGVAVVNALSDSAWGVFSISASVPIAMIMGFYIFRLHKGSDRATKIATVAGVIALFAAVIFGKPVADSAWGSHLRLSREAITLSIAAYGFIASVLPVWLLLCPRDYLSSYMKLGTIAVLVLAVILVHPDLKMPALSIWTSGGGPIIPGKVFPFVFVTIACGAISGFHSLIASGTTPKMLNREPDARMIGYGAMLFEGLVGVVALIAACSLNPGDYFAINVAKAKFASLGLSTVHLPDLEAAVGEHVAGRTGGAVSLAVGIAQILGGLPWLGRLLSYWYHFAIMFEALFILTTIDSGTRVARFLIQEAASSASAALGFSKAAREWARQDSVPVAVAASALAVIAWTYFILTGTISTIWPMFGIANQLLAIAALAIGTTYLLNRGAGWKALVTALPMLFVGLTTVTAGVESIRGNFLPNGAYVSAALTVFLLGAVGFLLAEACAHNTAFASRKIRHRKNR